MFRGADTVGWGIFRGMRRYSGVPKQGDGGYSGVPKQGCGDITDTLHS